MGKWTLESISGSGSALDEERLYGNNFTVRLRLSYAPSAAQKAMGKLGVPSLGKFEESPVLYWQEKITLLDHGTGRYWQYEDDMFRLKPISPTYHAWARRYIAAYDFVRNQHLDLQRGTVAFYDVKGNRLPQNEFEVKTDNKEKADIIRAYLMKKGGIFDITIHDVPGIHLNPQPDAPVRNVERLLQFDCGLEGVPGQRVKAVQHVIVITNQPRNSWTQEFEISDDNWSRANLPTDGLEPEPDGVPLLVKVKKDTLFPGESL